MKKYFIIIILIITLNHLPFHEQYIVERNLEWDQVLINIRSMRNHLEPVKIFLEGNQLEASDDLVLQLDLAIDKGQNVIYYLKNIKKELERK